MRSLRSTTRTSPCWPKAYERLDRRRSELALLERDVTEVKALARQQRDYARAIVVSAARNVRSAESQRDGVTRVEREAREALQSALNRRSAADDERLTLETRFTAIGVEIDALKDSDAYRAGAGLTDLRRLAEHAAAGAEQASRAAAQRQAEHAATAGEAGVATSECAVAASNLDLAERDLRAAAEPAGASAVVDEAVSMEDADEAERLVRAWARAQRTRLDEVRARLDAHNDAVKARDFLDEQVAADERAVDERMQAQATADEALHAAAAAYAAAVTEWAGGCEHLGAELTSHLPAPPDDPDAVVAATAEVAAGLREALARARQTISAARDAAETERAALLVERERWEHGQLVDPDGPSWRSGRSGLPGGPLWRLVDVRPETAPYDVDALEAALTGAGLVDAWVRDDGTVEIGPERADVVLGTRPAAGETLADLLFPAQGGAVAAGIVHSVLASIPVCATAAEAATDVAIGRDGSYRLGNAVGRGPQRPAMLLGAVARERHRLTRLAEIDAALAVLDGGLAELDREAAGLDRRQAAADAELAAQPSGEPVDAATRALADAMARLDDARERLAQSSDRRRTAEDAVRASLRELTALAARHRLPADRDGLAQLRTALDRLEQAQSTWSRRARELQAATRLERRALERAAAAAAAADRARADAEAAARVSAEAAQRWATLEASVGADHTEVVHRITACENERDANRARSRELDADKSALDEKIGELRSRVQVAERERADAEAERDRTQQRLVKALTDLGADADVVVPEGLATATAILAAARRAAADHEDVDVDEQTVERLSGRVVDGVHHTQTALGARIDLDRVLTDDGWWVLRTTASGVHRRVGELATSLRATLDAGRAELAKEEEELFERTLAGGVRRALADRIRQANALTATINAQLTAVRTDAGGVQVRLSWEVDPEQPPAVRSARQLLLRDPADLSDGERRALQEFVRARVDQARAELEESAPWEARLRETLDYRSWHRFTLQVAHRDWPGFQPATAKRLARLSTGERSIVLHLPMIASVAAHYTSDGAPSTCPRLILLDELFAGVDVANRAQLFGTFTDWDLDAIFTSDSEWCSYATLDGIAIHHLHPPVGEDEPVTSTRFTWDGRVKSMDPAA